MNNAEEMVSKFYNSIGWKTEGEITEDARRWEDLRYNARDYVSKCRLRVLRHIPNHGKRILDMASGPIQYKEYLDYSRNFQKRYCVDLSLEALGKAKDKIGDHGVYLHGSFFDIQLEDNFFDCTISLHTVYHIDKDRQEEAVRKLVRVTKAGSPVIIVYSNPQTLITSLRYSLPMRVLEKVKKRFSEAQSTTEPNPESAIQQKARLYFYAHPIDWWERFGDIASVRILPWRSFASNDQKRIVPDNKLGACMLRLLFALEDAFPRLFVRHFQYPMIILTKKEPRSVTRIDPRPGSAPLSGVTQQVL